VFYLRILSTSSLSVLPPTDKILKCSTSENRKILSVPTLNFSHYILKCSTCDTHKILKCSASEFDLEVFFPRTLCYGAVSIEIMYRRQVCDLQIPATTSETVPPLTTSTSWCSTFEFDPQNLEVFLHWGLFYDGQYQHHKPPARIQSHIPASRAYGVPPQTVTKT
jgi:hypothetical protein